MKKHIHQDVYIGAVSLVFCFIVFLANKDLPGDAGTMPLMLDALLALFSAIILIGGIYKSKPMDGGSGEEGLTIDGVKIPFLMWGLVGVYVFLFYLFGYLISTAIMLFVMMFFMKERNYKIMIAVDAAYILIMRVVFIGFLKVNADGFGLLERLLG